jgi:hypothetical protein
MADPSGDYLQRMVALYEARAANPPFGANPLYYAGLADYYRAQIKPPKPAPAPRLPTVKGPTDEHHP